ncbi:Protein of unknown function (DUF2757) [Halobacteroides halobius DSM 5150]|uniref:Uncharacterized protein n=1 Tax=Halobacteroides halobius (strain ATCC 35273 / DSM 5150 / MD-1) TaxID=748449 RepID=L0K4B5_HALHC|nr:anti-sigma-F factor Fin family protein [Halobacteroides halobius]AGB40122.1 Protein of unknown function (DUF2757) [Halobacteroides halobius DSM 5150]
MNLVYRCPQCQKVIDQLAVPGEIDDEALGFNVLTAEEREDIIEVEEDNTYVNVVCDECAQDYAANQTLYNTQIH